MAYTIVKKEYTKEDMELLNSDFPENPCIECGMKEYCTGCDMQQSYARIYNMCKNADILDEAILITKMKKVISEINRLQHELNEMKSNLPEKLHHLVFKNDMKSEEKENFSNTKVLYKGKRDKGIPYDKVFSIVIIPLNNKNNLDKLITRRVLVRVLELNKEFLYENIDQVIADWEFI